MSKNSIGSLFIDIQARTARLETDMRKVREVVQSATPEVQKVSETWNLMSETGRARIARFAAALFGAQTMVRILANEIRNVVENIEKIPGINPMVAASVGTLRDNLYELRQNIRETAANVAGYWSDAWTAWGVQMADIWSKLQWHDRGEALPEGELKAELADLDKLAAAQDAAYGDRVQAATSELAKRRLEAARAAKEDGTQVKELWELSQRFEVISKSRNFNSLQRLNFELEGLRLEVAGNQKLHALKEQLQRAEESLSNSVERGARAKLSDKERVDALSAAVGRLRYELSQLADLQRDITEKKGKADPELLEKQVKLTRQLSDVQRQLAIAEQKYGEFAREAGETIASNFEEAIIKGGKLREVLRGLAQDLIALMVRRFITGPMGNFLGDIFSSIGKSAVGGPIEPGKPRLVGEYGPELIMPSTHSTVIPNEQLRSNGGGGSQSFVMNFNIAPGVTRGELVPMLEAWGRRVKSEVSDSVRRGGSYRQAFT